MKISFKVFCFTESCLADIALEESKLCNFDIIEHFYIFKMVSKMKVRNSKNQYFSIYRANL